MATEAATVRADDVAVLLDDDAIGVGVDIDGPADSRSGNRVLVVVIRAGGRLDQMMAHQLLEAPVEGSFLTDEHSIDGRLHVS